MAGTTTTEVRVPAWVSILFGLISVAAGVAALAWPGITIFVLVSLLGIHILIYGILAIGNAFRTGEGRLLGIVFGVLALLAGTSLWLQPLRNLGPVLVVVSVFWIVGGIIQTIGSLVERDDRWVAEFFSGLLSFVAGMVVIVWPGITLLAMAVTAGVWMVAIGLVRIGTAFARGRAAPPASA